MGLRPREVESVVQGQKMMEGVYSSRIHSHSLKALDETALSEQCLTPTQGGTFSSAGAGVRICRTLGTSKLRNLDPFLMLDELRMPARQASAGFPDHPHRGFETCSIMFSGKMEHHDSVGNQVRMFDAGNGEYTKRANSDLHILACMTDACRSSIIIVLQNSHASLPSCIKTGSIPVVTLQVRSADATHCVFSQGVIGPGGVQWMTAGRGIVHSEMPKVTEGDLWGFQLWINLPAKDKMVKPR